MLFKTQTQISINQWNALILKFKFCMVVAAQSI